MNLILWRHADAEDTAPDHARALTARGRKQAERIARWLREQLPERFVAISSPAVRARQTADALGCAYAVDERLAPGADAAHYLAAVDWPAGPGQAKGTVVVVGHQPAIGRVASLLLCGTELDWSVRKGAVWWLSTRERPGSEQVVLRAVICPDQI